MKLTILMPCLNEAETLGTCVSKATAWLAENNVDGEVVVADNGSTDGSQEIARANGARVVQVPARGYGSALFHGSMAARGEYIIMGDSDDSYDFRRLEEFYSRLEMGDDLVMGNRFAGGIADGAMPWKNRYIGNPILSLLGRLLFKCPVRDFHCGLRGVRKDAFLKMDLRTTGMEYASEMVIKASILKLKVSEVPTTLSKDGRSRPPHLRPWRDGWRHLRFMLLFSPRWLFFIPGLTIFFVSLLTYLAILFNVSSIDGVTLGIHSLFFAQAGIIVAIIMVMFGVIVRSFGMREGMLGEHKLLRWSQEKPFLEIGGLAGVVVASVGAILGFSLLKLWSSQNFGNLDYGVLLKSVSISTLCLMAGGITVVFSMILGFLNIPTRRDT